MNLGAFNRDLMRAALGLGALFAGISWAFWDAHVALGIALTSPVAALWLRATATAVHRLVFDPSLRAEGAQPPGGEGWKFVAKLPLVALALTCILWYMPARPEGVAIGVLNGLLAAIFAGIRHNPPLRD